MKTRVIGCIAIAATALVACDQVKVTAQWDSPLPLLRDESPAGIYLGTFTETSGVNPVARPVTAIIDADGNVQIIFAMAAQRHVAGRVDVSGDRLTGTLTEYSGTVAGFTGANGVSELMVQGSVSTGGSITGDYVAESHSGRFLLNYQMAFGTPSSLNLTAGIWSFSMVSSGGSIYTVTWDIDDDGQVFGTDTLGCVFFGRLAVADGFVAAYGLAVQVDACGSFDGNYAGQAFLSTGSGGAADGLTLGMANDVFAFTTVLQRQSPP